MTRESIRQIEMEALRKLKHPSRSRTLRSFWIIEFEPRPRRQLLRTYAMAAAFHRKSFSSLSRLALCTALAGAICIASLIEVGAQSPTRSGTAPCRQGALALIAMLDRGENNTADYRSAYDAVVQSCGPRAAAAPPVQREPSSSTKVCSKLALEMLDVIEDGKINSQRFVQTRDRFARSCVPHQS